MVCEIPFETLDDLSGKMPNLRQQMMRLMSGEIKGDQDMILLLSKKNAEERLAAFIYNLSRRFAQRGFSPREFRLTMTRGDIGNYLGLTVETISRLLGRFQKSGMLAVKGKYITIENNDALAQLGPHAAGRSKRLVFSRGNSQNNSVRAEYAEDGKPHLRPHAGNGAPPAGFPQNQNPGIPGQHLHGGNQRTAPDAHQKRGFYPVVQQIPAAGKRRSRGQTPGNAGHAEKHLNPLRSSRG